jgi:protein-tyrosine phosphatase
VTDAGGRVLVVCTGNVCRSPFIQLLLQGELDARRRNGGPRTVVTSAGVGALAGQGMDARAAAQATAYGLDPSGFVARQLTAPMVAEADLVLTATRKHRGDVATLHPRALRYTFTLLDFADLAAHLDGVGLSDAQPRSQAWLQDVVRSVASRRGLEPPLEPCRADVVDPFRREDDLFVQMADQISGAVAAAAAVLSG